MKRQELEKELQKNKNEKKAKEWRKFFQIVKGGYGEGETLLGVAMGQQREVAKKFVELGFREIQGLLGSNIHEYKMTGVLILVYKFEAGDKCVKKQVFDFYLKNKYRINNWDYVDVSAHKIVGRYLLENCNKKEIKDFYKKLWLDENLWARRIAIVSNWTIIRQNEYDYILSLAKKAINDDRDLIQKATGWMLREMGKRDSDVLENFLEINKDKMPRTMLRYSIEKFPSEKRKYYLKKI